MKKKNKKLPDKSGSKKIYVILSAIGTAVLIGVILAIVLPAPISAAVNLSKAKSFAEDHDAVIAVEIHDQTKLGDDLTGNSSVILRDSEAKAVAEQVYDVINNAKYKGTNSVTMGVWKTRIVMINDIDEYTLYVDENGVYIYTGNKLISYSVGEKAGDSLLALLTAVEENK